MTAITTIRGTAISTHTSRVGCDHRNLHLVFLEKQFLLTHPVWDVTSKIDDWVDHFKISTHTSRVGCDISGAAQNSGGITFLLTHPVWDVTAILDALTAQRIDFYSHIPCGM